MSTSPNWWELIKRLFGVSRQDLSGSGQNLLQPPDRPLGLNDAYTVSGSYVNSGLKEAFNDAQFYYVDDNGELQLVQDTSRIVVVKRAYYNGDVGLVFRDQASGRICNPRGVQFNTNVVPNPQRAGEYLLRSGGSVDGTSPRNIMWNSPNIEYVSNIVKNSVVTAPPPPTPTPPPVNPNQKIANTSDYAGLQLRHMVGNASVPYNGVIVLTQVQKNGYWVITIKDEGGESLGVGNNSFRNLWSGSDQGYKIPNSQITSADGDAFGWLSRNYADAPTPPVAPPDMNQHTVGYDTSKIKYWFKTVDGKYYTGAITIEYNFSGGNYYWTKFKTPDGQYLTLINPANGGRLAAQRYTGTTPSYKIMYTRGNTFIQDLDKQMGGTVDPPPSPLPPLPSGFTRIEGDTTTSAWKFLRLLNEDGTPYTGQYYIEYKQRRFRGQLGGQIQNVTFYTLDSNGNKQYIKADFGEVNWGLGGSNQSPIFDQNGNIVGEQYNFTLPDDSRGSLEDFLNQYYDTDRGLYPDDPPPEPPAPSGEQILGTIESEDFVGLIFSNG